MKAWRPTMPQPQGRHGLTSSTTLPAQPSNSWTFLLLPSLDILFSTEIEHNLNKKNRARLPTRFGELRWSSSNPPRPKIVGLLQYAPDNKNRARPWTTHAATDPHYQQPTPAHRPNKPKGEICCGLAVVADPCNRLIHHHHRYICRRRQPFSQLQLSAMLWWDSIHSMQLLLHFSRNLFEIRYVWLRTNKILHVKKWGCNRHWFPSITKRTHISFVYIAYINGIKDSSQRKGTNLKIYSCVVGVIILSETQSQLCDHYKNRMVHPNWSMSILYSNNRSKNDSSFVLYRSTIM